MIIKWKNDYSCYDPTIDEQHQRLMALINQMNDIAELKDDVDHYDEIAEVFYGLKDYAIYHFSHEEKMFKETGYDSLNEKIQIIEHKKFIDKVSSINMYEMDENQMGTIREILDFLSMWLDHHILVIDKMLYNKFEKT